MCQPLSNITTRTKATDLTEAEDFPLHCKPRVRFDDRTQIQVLKHDSETDNVARNELWYTESEYDQMKRAAKTVRRLTKLRERRSSLDFTKKQLKKFADEHRQHALLSLEPNIIPPKYPVQYAIEICSGTSSASDDL